MTKKQKKIWARGQDLLKTIQVSGFPPFDQVTWYLAVTKKNRLMVLGKVEMPNAEDHCEILSLVNSFVLRAPMKIKVKRFAFEAYKLLEDIAIHEIGEHFLFLGRRAFNQHDNDWRYKSKKLHKNRTNYPKWMTVAEQQLCEMNE